MGTKDPPGIPIDREYLEVGKKYSVMVNDISVSLSFTALFVGYMSKDGRLWDEYHEDQEPLREEWSNGVSMDTWIGTYMEVTNEEEFDDLFPFGGSSPGTESTGHDSQKDN